MSKLTPREILTAGAVVPVMAIDDLSTAVDLSHALVEGGIPTLEITLRTPVGLDAIRLIAKEVPNAIVGAGTVTNLNSSKPSKTQARFSPSARVCTNPSPKPATTVASP